VEESAPILAMLKRHEGARREGGRHRAYLCPAGVLTIGWGHSLEARPIRGLGPGSSISEAEAESLLRADLTELAFLLDTRMPWWRGLGPARSAVLLDMAFNLGLSGLLGFRKMLAAVRRNSFDEAAREMLDSRWAAQVGTRARELAAMMKSGKWNDNNKKEEI
jgi:lysozyme